MSQLSDFIDRAKLEAAMLQVDVAHFASKKPHPTVEDYATAVLALLDAETTEEWGVAYPNATWNAAPGYPMVEHLARELVDESEGVALVSRHVVRTPWLPSEGGEKRG